ncbi:MAG: hypothetical protein JWR80_5686 [Bradyrhizobium sp.]|nr:hypothetical protein [Bradyrhizobium sp.]
MDGRRNEHQSAAGLALTPIGRADDDVDIDAFLASDAARFITGKTIHVDGQAKL